MLVAEGLASTEGLGRTWRRLQGLGLLFDPLELGAEVRPLWGT